MSRPHSRCLRASAGSARARGAALAALVVALATFLVPRARAQEGGGAATVSFHTTSEAAAKQFSVAWDELNNVNPAGAVGHLQKAMSLDPGFGLARVLYGFAAPGLSRERRSGEIDRGMAMLSEASAPEVLLALSWREWNAGRRTGAIAATRAAVELAPGDARVAFQLAQLGAPGAPGPDMIEALRKIVKDHPDFAPAYNNLAYASWAEGDHAAALDAVRRYAELRSDHPNPHDSYAELLQWDGQRDRAEAEYRRALELDPSFHEAYMGLAELSWLAGDHDEARAYIRTAMERAPEGTPRLRVQRALAHTYLMEGKAKEAMEGLASVADEAEAAGNKGFAASVHRQMAVADAMLGKGEKVEAHLGAANVLAGRDTPGSDAWTALAYASANRHVEATAALDRLEKSAADDAQMMGIARTGRAIVMGGEGQHEEALATLGEPTDDMGRAVSAECLKKLKRNAEATKMKTAVLETTNFSFYDSVRPFAVLRASKI